MPKVSWQEAVKLAKIVSKGAKKASDFSKNARKAAEMAPCHVLGVTLYVNTCFE
jgi:hypothetical protein